MHPAARLEEDAASHVPYGKINNLCSVTRIKCVPLRHRERQQYETLFSPEEVVGMLLKAHARNVVLIPVKNRRAPFLFPVFAFSARASVCCMRGEPRCFSSLHLAAKRRTRATLAVVQKPWNPRAAGPLRCTLGPAG